MLPGVASFFLIELFSRKYEGRVKDRFIFCSSSESTPVQTGVSVIATAGRQKKERKKEEEKKGVEFHAGLAFAAQKLSLIHI